MYESYWGLKVRPFDHRADAKFYYPAESQQAALAKLRYALERGGNAAVIAGGAGTGKTLLVDLVERQLNDRGYVFVRLVFPFLSPAEILGYLADELEDEKPTAAVGNSLDQTLHRIEKRISQLAAQDKQVVFVVDEAHLIDEPRTLESLRLLLNFENAKHTPPALVLIGQPRLLQALLRVPSFDERLTAKCLLKAFSAEETAAYIVHRLKSAGVRREVFDASAVEAVHALSQGVPRRINRLCDLALVVGYAEERKTIAAAQIEAVSDELLSLASTDVIAV